MKLERAIKDVEEEVKHPYSAKKMARPDALKLLIEAGKYIQYRDNCPGINTRLLLPGETDLPASS